MICIIIADASTKNLVPVQIWFLSTGDVALVSSPYQDHTCIKYLPLLSRTHAQHTRTSLVFSLNWSLPLLLYIDKFCARGASCTAKANAAISSLVPSASSSFSASGFQQLQIVSFSTAWSSSLVNSHSIALSCLIVHMHLTCTCVHTWPW